MEGALIIFSISYSLLLIGLYWGWRKIPEAAVGEQLVGSDSLKFTVVIPVRNEEVSIGLLLEDLSQQSYQNFEVIVVDDHSEDQTASIVKGIVQSYDYFHYLQLPESKKGKKAALTEGIHQGQGQWIVTTDGDCRVSLDWLKVLAHHLQGSTNKMVCGSVLFSPFNSLFEKMMAVEFSSAIGTGAACIGWKHPLMCSGANLAFERKAFWEVNGYQGNEHIASGDDEFLLKKFVQQWPTSITFIKAPAHVVRTLAPSGWKALLQQRIRWAGKWRLQNGVSAKLLAVYMFFLHLTYAASPLLWMGGLLSSNALFLAWLLRGGTEFFFLRDVLKSMTKSKVYYYTPFVVLWYSYYVVLVGLMGTFASYQWKQRKYTV
ncbi:glycosyltransferase [Algivirga pacifica]|uniref:Glycosyltransferase n=1 Tax=Algivirga pacifica TaxID=1162670 RepID=A0ABP9DLV1_9BACT